MKRPPVRMLVWVMMLAVFASGAGAGTMAAGTTGLSIATVTAALDESVYLPLVLRPLIPQPTPSPTATLAPPCSEAVANGSFESGAAWTFPVTDSTASITTAQAHSGVRAARFGLIPAAQASARSPDTPERNLLGELAPAGATFSTGYQTVTIPAGAASATLSFWYRPGSEAWGEDFQRVLLLQPGTYDLIANLMQVLEYDGVWKQRTFDLTAYRGRSIVIYFEVYNNSTAAAGRTWMYVDDVSLQVCMAATGTPTATKTPTVTPTPTAIMPCSEAVANGGFEAGGSWTFPVTDSTASITTAQAHSGARAARFGLLPAAIVTARSANTPERNLLGELAPAGATFSTGYQTVTIPAGATSAALSFWYRPGSEAWSEDFQRVLLLQPGTYDLIANLMQVLEYDGVWKQRTFDLTAYRGRSIVIYFEVYNNSTAAAGRTWMYVDDVSFQVCMAATGTPTATKTPTATRTPTTTATPSRTATSSPTPTATTTPTPTVILTPPADALVINGEWVRDVVGQRASSTMYAYSDLHLYRSDDAGEHWALKGAAVGEFLMSPANADVLYNGPGYPCLAGGPNIPMYKSTNGGASWVELPAGMNLKVLAAHPADSERVYAAGCDGPYVSTSGGAGWAHQPSPLWAVFEVKLIVPLPPSWQTVYIAGVAEGGGGAIIKISDGGLTWQQITPVMAWPEIWWITDLLVDLANPDTVRFTEPHAAWWSNNGGSTWFSSAAGLSDVVYDPAGPPDRTYGLHDLELDVADPQRLYLATVRGLYRTGDGGASWHKVTNGYSWQDASLRKLLLLEANPSKLFLVRQSPGQGVHVFDLSGLPPVPTATPTSTPSATATRTPTPTPTLTATVTPSVTPAVPYILRLITLPGGSHPHGIALDTAGNRIFVGHHGPAHDGHALSVIDGSSLTVARTIDLGASALGANGVGYHAASGRVYVANRNSDNVSVVDPTAGALVTQLPVGSQPNGVAVVGNWVYVANFASHTVTAINASTATVHSTIQMVGTQPSHFAVNEPEGYAYLSVYGDGAVTYLRDGLRGTYVPGVPSAYGIAFDPLTRRLFVGNRSVEAAVTQIAVDSNTVLGTFTVGHEPYMLGVNPTTQHLFVVTRDSVEVRRTSDASLITSLALPVGAEEGIAVDAVRNRVYISSSDSNCLAVVQDVP